jgi:hypothetical protein
MSESNRRTIDPMADEEDEAEKSPPVNWAELRVQAEKLGLTLSQLQQQQREQRLRLARKIRPIPPAKPES